HKSVTSGQREVLCTHCGKPTQVARRAMSVFCPHCRQRLILEDFKIKTYYAVRDFSTCGDIVVERRGHVVAPIRVGNLTVKGKVQGRVRARGRVYISKTGWFKGELEAKSLQLEQGAVLEGFVRIGVPPDEAEPNASPVKGLSSGTPEPVATSR
ncbi:MAG: polymer-forming cytoskeletal protein, partial [Planctomycetota bacterium]